jgi:hypothetical protein
MSLCSEKISKCSKLRNTLIEVSKRSPDELGTEIPIGMIDTDKNPKLAMKWIDEGFATLYYVNQEETEKEVYLGLKQAKNIIKYLKFKLVSNIESVDKETQLLASFNSNLLRTAIVFFGSENSAPFTISTLARAGREAGINKVFIVRDEKYLDKLKIDDFDVAIFSKDHHKSIYDIKRLYVQDEDDLSMKKLRNILIINYRNLNGYFSFLKESDLELIFNQNLPTLFYVYSDKSQLSKSVEADITDLAKKYANEFLFFKSPINSKPLKLIELNRLFNFTKQDLPALVLTNENPSNSDDVEKFYANQLLAKRVKTMEGLIVREREEKELDSELIDKYIVEQFIDKYKIRALANKLFSEPDLDENEFKMTAEYFAGVIDEALGEGNEVLLIICPRSIKKFNRIRARIYRTYQKIHKLNNEKILFDEIDPFLNEVSYINYKYYPTLALIQKSKIQEGPNRWNVHIKENGFTHDQIINFVKSHTSLPNFKVNNTALGRDLEINELESKHHLYPVLKNRLDAKLLSENLIKGENGFRRRWLNLKRTGQVPNIVTVDNGNEYEEDFDDNIEVNDNIDESVFGRKDEL